MPIETLIVLPVLVPLLAGVGMLWLPAGAGARKSWLMVATGINLVGASLLFVKLLQSDAPVEVAFGGWESPVGIAFYVDLFAGLMVLVAALIGFCGAWYALGEIGQVLWRRHYGFFYLLLFAGINGAFLTGDLFNLFVWFEVMLMASFAMMVMGRNAHTVEGATKYVVLNMLSSFFFLAGLGIFYGKTGSLNLNDVAMKLASASGDPLVLTSGALLLLAFGIKAGVFPLYFWLPASYPYTGFTTAAVFGGLLTKVGVYALFRVFGGALGFLSAFTADLFLWIGGFTMVVGVLGAASQFHLRRILSFHIVSQIGYLTLGLGLFTQGAFAAAIFYTVHHIIVKTNLFFAAGVISASGRSERLEKLGGLFTRAPLLALLFAIPALSLGGIPPLSGFFAKFLIIRETLREEAWIVAMVALVVGVLTLFSMTKIWSEAFWKDSPRLGALAGIRPGRLAPVAVLATVTVVIGLAFGPIYEIADRAAFQLLAQNPAGHEGAAEWVLGTTEDGQTSMDPTKP